ncbi:MAG: divergent PAP2 family protein [bacterium]
MSGLWQNEILLTSLLAWAIAQGLKVPLTLLTSHKWDFNRLVSPGGMPSSHSALVTALATFRWACAWFGGTRDGDCYCFGF